MYNYQIIVSFRKGGGPEWIARKFDVSIDAMDTFVTEEELQEWAKDDVRSQIETSEKLKQLGEHWVISEVIKM